MTFANKSEKVLKTINPKVEIRISAKVCAIPASTPKRGFHPNAFIDYMASEENKDKHLRGSLCHHMIHSQNYSPKIRGINEISKF
nr:hypothetical protein [uncultured Prevotella sp.]